MIDITDTVFDPEGALAIFRAEASHAGAIASFTGIVRDDGATERLTLSHYAGFTETQIAAFQTAAAQRFDLIGSHIIHRVGDMVPGDVIVFVATAATHRRAAFEACDFLMDKLKSEAPFWKSEMRNGQSTWIEPRAQDGEDLARWSE